MLAKGILFLLKSKRGASVEEFFEKSHSPEKILKRDPLVSPYFYKHENSLGQIVFPISLLGHQLFLNVDGSELLEKKLVTV